MLIVSNDGGKIVNLDNVLLFEINNVFDTYKVFAISSDMKSTAIGTYETEVEARLALNNLLDEYQNRIPDKNTVYKMP